jgi:hypothetical protein
MRTGAIGVPDISSEVTGKLRADVDSIRQVSHDLAVSSTSTAWYKSVMISPRVSLKEQPMDNRGSETTMRFTDVHEGRGGSESRPSRRRKAAWRVAAEKLSVGELIALGLPNVSPARIVKSHGLEIPVLNSLEILERARSELDADYAASGLSHREWLFWHRRGVRFATLPEKHRREFARDVADAKRRAKLVQAWERAQVRRRS